MAVTFRYADGRVEARAVNTGGTGLPDTWTLRVPVDAEGQPVTSPLDAARWELHTFLRVAIKHRDRRRPFHEYHETPPCGDNPNAGGRGFCCPMLREADRRMEGPS